SNEIYTETFDFENFLTISSVNKVPFVEKLTLPLKLSKIKLISSKKSNGSPPIINMLFKFLNQSLSLNSSQNSFISNVSKFSTLFPNTKQYLHLPLHICEISNLNFTSELS